MGMLFLVITTPHPEKPENVTEVRLRFLEWIEKLQASGKILTFYPRPGRGAIAIFDVESNEEFHTHLTQWLSLIPAQIDIYPLISPSTAKRMLQKTKATAEDQSRV